MEEQIKTIEGLVEANKAVKVGDRTPFLDVSLGALRTALENLKEHVVQTSSKPTKK